MNFSSVTFRSDPTEKVIFFCLSCAEFENFCFVRILTAEEQAFVISAAEECFFARG